VAGTGSGVPLSEGLHFNKQVSGYYKARIFPEASMTTTSAPSLTTERLISADDHVDIEHDQVKQFLASKFHAEYDTAVGEFMASMSNLTSAEANQRWRLQHDVEVDKAETTSAMFKARNHAAAGRAGHSDSGERLKDMDSDGVDASSTYCEVSAFRYLYMLKNGSREATRAFNSALAEWASADSRRLVVSYQIPIHDIDAAVAEVEWAAATGGKSLQLPVFPAELGLADYWDSRYDPLWSAISETGLPICCHIGLNSQLDALARRDPTPQKGIFVPMVGLSSAEAFGMWLLTGVLVKHPKLKIVFVEPGVGWVPFWLHLVDDMALRQGYEFPELAELPSHYFHQNIFLTFIDEPGVIDHARSSLGIENIMWSSDYPHPVSSWPKSRQTVEEMFGDATPEERQLIVSGNAARIWNLG
jgi:predicted TIM-barrel fold metal-dependent hydrolase